MFVGSWLGLKAGERLRGLWRPGIGVAKAMPGCTDPPLDLHCQSRLAAKQMRAARDVEGYPIRRIECDHRCPSVAAIGNSLKPQAVGMRIMFDRSKFRNTRTGIGQRQARCEAEAQCPFIDGHDTDSAALLLDKRERCVIRPEAMRRAPAIGRKQGKPQRQIPPLRGNLLGHDPIPIASIRHRGGRAAAAIRL